MHPAASHPVLRMAAAHLWRTIDRARCCHLVKSDPALSFAGELGVGVQTQSHIQSEQSRYLTVIGTLTHTATPARVRTHRKHQPKHMHDAAAGVATSSDGVNWRRGADAVAGRPGDSAEVGRVLGPNADNWWWHDTCHLSVSDVQVGGFTGFIVCLKPNTGPVPSALKSAVDPNTIDACYPLSGFVHSTSRCFIVRM